MIKMYRNFFIIYCIGSGFAALTLVLNSLIQILDTVITMTIEQQLTKPSFVIMYVYALSISLYGIFCGVKIANNSPNGKKYLKYYLIPQIPLISIPGFIYYFKLGLDFTIYTILDTDVGSLLGTRMNFAIGSFFNLNFDTSITERVVLVGVNFVPIILLGSLIVSKKRFVPYTRKNKSKKKSKA